MRTVGLVPKQLTKKEKFKLKLSKFKTGFVKIVILVVKWIGRNIFQIITTIISVILAIAQLKQ